MKDKNIFKFIWSAIHTEWIYIQARIIMKNHYDKNIILRSRYAKDGKYKNRTSTIWKWIVNDFRGCKVMHVNKNVPWPVSPACKVSGAKNIVFHPDDLNNFQNPGCYFQAIGHIVIGKGSYIAPNVGLITANHNKDDLDKHDPPKDIILGSNCWIGMNSVILPGVILGDNTIVGAGAVVTHSFPEGHCTIAGNPAQIISKR